MYIDPRPIRPAEDDPPSRRGGPLPVFAFALFALLAVAGTILLGRYDAGMPLRCGEDPADCGIP